MNIIQPLPLRVRPAADEPAYALLNRLALRHQAYSVGDLIEQIVGVAYKWAVAVQHGRRLEELSLLTLVPASDLFRSTVRFDKRSILIGDTVLADRYMISSLRYGRACPACLAEDMDLRAGPDACRATRRSTWDIAPLVSCPKHNAVLISACATCNQAVGKHWLDPRRCPEGHVVQPTGEAISFGNGQDYLLRRLRSEHISGGKFLDGLPVLAAAQAMAGVGRARIYGRKWPRGDRGPAELSDALVLGLETLSDWPAGFSNVLDDLRREAGKGRPGPDRAYGKSMMWWLQYGGGSMFQALHDVVVEHYARSGINTRHAFISQSVISWTSLRSLADELKIDLPRLQRVAEDMSLDLHRDEGTPKLSPDAANCLRARFADTVRGRTAAADRLGISFSQTKELLRQKVISPIAPKSSYFEGSILNELISRCVARVPRNSQFQEGLTPLPDMPAMSGRSLAALVGAITAGHLPVAGIDETKRGLRSVLVCIEDVRANVQRGNAVLKLGVALMGPQAASLRLGISPGKVERLANKGILAPVRLNDRAAYRTVDLDRLIADCRGDASVLLISPPGALSLVEIVKRTRRAWEHVIEALRSRLIVPVGVLSGRVGLDAICLDIDDLKARIPPLPQYQRK